MGLILGYTSESSVHWVSNHYPSFQVHLTILLLNIACYLLHRLKQKYFITVIHSTYHPLTRYPSNRHSWLPLLTNLFIVCLEAVVNDIACQASQTALTDDSTWQVFCFIKDFIDVVYCLLELGWFNLQHSEYRSSPSLHTWQWNTLNNGLLFLLALWEVL